MKRNRVPATPSAATTFEAYDATYDPIPSPTDGSCLLHEHHEVAHAGERRVWTVVEVDDAMAILAGFHVVNQIGYLLTRKPWVSGDEQFDYLPA